LVDEPPEVVPDPWWMTTGGFMLEVLFLEDEPWEDE